MTGGQLSRYTWVMRHCVLHRKHYYALRGEASKWLAGFARGGGKTSSRYRFGMDLWFKKTSNEIERYVSVTHVVPRQERVWFQRVVM